MGRGEGGVEEGGAVSRRPFGGERAGEKKNRNFSNANGGKSLAIHCFVQTTLFILAATNFAQRGP